MSWPQPAPEAPVVVWVGGAVVVVTGGRVVVGAGATVVVGAAVGVVTGTVETGVEPDEAPDVEVVPGPVVVEVAEPEPEPEPECEPVDVVTPPREVDVVRGAEELVPAPAGATVVAVAAVAVDEVGALASAAASTEVACTVASREATVRRSAAIVRLRAARALASVERCRWTAKASVVVVVALGRVDPTKEFATPAPTMETEATTAVGITRRRSSERSWIRRAERRLASRR